jgi:hypothetical protein
VVWVAEVLLLPPVLRELKLEEAPARLAGAVAGLAGAGVLALVKWVVERGRAEVKLVTGSVDLGIGGYLLYEQATKRTPPDPLVDTAKFVFGLLEVLVGGAAIASGIGDLLGVGQLKYPEKTLRSLLELVPT